MSAPAFAWAFEQGYRLGLTSSQLLLLLYMADQANCAGQFYTGQPRLVKYTRLSVRTVRQLIPQLRELGLIQVQAVPGHPTLYQIARQPLGEAVTAAQAATASPANGAAPANAAGVTPAATAAQPRQSLPDHPGNLRHIPRQNLHATPAATAADPLVTQEEDPKTRVSTREAAGFKNSEPQGGTPPPAPPVPRAPTIGTTDGSGSYRQPGASAYAPVEEARAEFQAYLDAKRQQRDAAKPAAPEPRAEPKAVRRAAASVIYSLRKYAPAEGAKPQRSRSEQVDQVLHGEAIAPLRRGPVEPQRSVAEQLAALGFPQTVEAVVTT